MSKQVNKHPTKPLVIGISSRVLFDLGESHQVFVEKGLRAYTRHQVKKENDILPKGPAFTLVQKLLGLNVDGENRVEVLLISRNSADTGLRIFNSIEHYQLPISRAAFCSGRNPFRYIEPFGCQLFLSADETDVRTALEAGFAAARVINTNQQASGNSRKELCIAFDGDSVIFSDEAERIYQQQGLDSFQHNESNKSQEALPGGPFQCFLSSLYSVQQSYPPETCPIRTALVTARSAPAHKRVILTLRSWNIRLDESFFLGGVDKRKFLEAFHTDIFFDDQHSLCQSASKGVTTGHVPFGIKNKRPSD